MRTYEPDLARIDVDGLTRRLHVRKPDMLEFSSNDYLDLAGHPLLKEASVRAIELYGSSVAASRLMSGNISLHEELEKRLARLTGMESALLFGSGYLANIGLLSSITSRDDLVFSDRLNHASLVDGALLSRAGVLRYRHCDTDHLEYFLANRTSRGDRFIVTDSLFSMDGDIAPLRKLEELSLRYNCNLIVDESHAIGVFGNGGGICRESGIKPHTLIGTLSKALGSYGGFAAGSADLIEYLINRARTFIYSTGLPPAAPAAALKALDIIESQPECGRKLLSMASDFRGMIEPTGYSTAPSESQIVPVRVGENRDAVAFSEYFNRNGISAVAIRPPTVPAGTARIRFSVTLRHSRKDLSYAAGKLDFSNSGVQ
ncbi:MAG: 8-amino-7-oxononanoate synthase [Candidatus Aegiribacteria sp.]|nr:8-amino-7-oxononanoate synthase [Candidatus Aegiribacteria sp.]